MVATAYYQHAPNRKYLVSSSSIMSSFAFSSSVLTRSALHGIPQPAVDPIMTVVIFCIGASAAVFVLYLL